MKDKDKTKEQLIQELEETRQQIGYSELSEAERKRVGEVAQETERRYRLVAENAADVIWTVGLDMQPTYISPSIVRLLGYSVEEAMVKPMKEVYTPASFEVATKVLAEELAIEKMEKKDLSRSRVLEFELKRKDGSIVPVEISYSFLRGADSQPFEILAIARDVTERKQMEETLRESQEHFQALAENSSDIIQIVDSEGFIRYVSPSVQRILGYKPEELIGRQSVDIVHPDDLPEVAKGFEKAIQEPNVPVAVECRCRHKDDTWRVIEGRGINRLDNPFVKGFISNMHDITERKWAEEAVKKEKKRVEEYLNIAGVMLVSLDANENITLMNRRGCEILGYKERKLIGKNWFDTLVPERIRDEVRGVFRKLMAGDIKPVEYYENPLLIKDGEERLIAFHNTVLRESDGQIVGALLSGEDITERKQMEEALRESEERYRAIFGSTGTATAIIEEDTTISLVNEEFVKLSGYSREELEGKKSWTEFVVVEDLDMMKERHKARRVDPGLAPTNYEFRFTDRQGNVKNILLTVNMISGTKKSVASLLDVTERKQMEEALRNSEEKYRTLVNNVRLGIFRSTPEPAGRFMEVNPAVEEITGYNRRELLQMDTANLYMNPEERSQVLKEMASGKGKATREARLRKKDGTEIVISDTKVTVRDDTGKVLYFDGIMEDITERKQMEEKAREIEALKELDRMQTELLANVSHELRTPLATIKGYSTMLLDYDTRLKRDEKRSYLGFIDKASDRLVGLIDQLLDMSRLESGAIEMDKAPTTVSKLIREVVAEAEVRKPGRRLVFNLPKRLPRLCVDARRIQQVLENIIDNAIKYSEEETEVVISARPAKQELLISVTDQGIGIPVEDLPKVFDRIYRTRQRKVMEVGGAGLGLSICQKLVEAHGGRIWIESEEGKGTTCYFTLPLATEEDRRGNEA